MISFIINSSVLQSEIYKVSKDPSYNKRPKRKRFYIKEMMENKYVKGLTYALLATGAVFATKGLCKTVGMLRYWMKKPVPLENLYGKGTWAAITGGSKGIGLEFGKQLGQKGFNILIIDKSEKANKKAVEELSKVCKGGVKVDSIAADITSSPELDTLLPKYDLSILINNAGIAAPGTFAEVPLAQHSSIISVNCFGTVKMTHNVLQRMLDRKDKSLIVFMSSFVDSIPLSYNSGYGASKAFVWSLARSLKDEVPEKIDVSVLRPLYVKTRLASFLPAEDRSVVTTEEFVSSSIKDIEKGRFASYGHWKHKLIGSLHGSSELFKGKVEKYFDDCNRRAYDWVKKHTEAKKKQ
eukprot:TRINITY_DN172_c0_g1_i4.p2 TRINITY_DN172_c0_g1~~TRINITY_DN172_c0_g1_i4.p2  ORF type:complete len:352 (-),score=57.75 TRINITY_DN172_c0_g1_i4:167-1222(-)